MQFLKLRIRAGAHMRAHACPRHAGAYAPARRRFGYRCDFACWHLLSYFSLTNIRTICRTENRIALMQKPIIEPELSRRKTKARRIAPSEPWVDAQFPECESTDESGDLIQITTHTPRAFPPGGKLTSMVVCPRCVARVVRLRTAELRQSGKPPDQAKRQAETESQTQRQRLHPPAPATEDGAPMPMCLDHVPRRYHAAYGRSASAMAIEFIGLRNLKSEDVEQVKLEKESRAALRREIKRHRQRAAEAEHIPA